MSTAAPAQSAFGDDAEPVIHFDYNGDLTLVVGPPEAYQSRFQVNKHVLMLASPVWRRMLDPSGYFIEA